jgi:mono/diheme cytochrome c family protein
MRQRAIILMAILALTVLGGAVLLYREAIAHGFSAREKPWAIEEFVARRLRKLAMGIEAKRLVNPLSPSPDLLGEAREHFADHCGVCHGDDGSGKTEIGEGLYPPVPDLRDPRTQELTDGELFSTIKNGIRFTGMPGWGGEDTDEEIWQLVLFLRHLPDLSPEELDHRREANAERGEAHHHEH